MPTLPQPLIDALLQTLPLPRSDPSPAADADDAALGAAVETLTDAFLRGVAARGAARSAARDQLQQGTAGPASELAELLLAGVDRIDGELAARAADTEFVAALRHATSVLEQADGPEARREAIWSILFPQGVGVLGHEREREAALRDRRLVAIEAPADDPITDPAREVLFTSNVLLTRPLTPGSADRLESMGLADRLAPASEDPQRHWYDHPIPLGTEPEANELLHGLRGLDDAIGFERLHGRAPGKPLPVVLSVSVTHDGLRPLARDYVEAELRAAGGLRHITPYVVTETEVRRLVDEVLAPAAAGAGALSGGAAGDRSPFPMLGVDGPYGRHYSFLKAVAAIWQVLVDPAVRATFKIDLDQVFPQEHLVAETGLSAFGHLANPRWGGRGRDSAGRPVDLGMIAGGLVNRRDIDGGLFTPDVPPARGPRAAHEWVFLSALPQAVSTRGEIVTRYDGTPPDGSRTVLERIHVTGGTNGIRVEALRRHRPFTPSFVGRAEDQAYILSVLGEPGPRLAYLHAAGLVMRHDKEAYARAAIEAAEVGKLVGDDLRILLFSAYVDLLADRSRDNPGVDGPAIRELLDPFTGAFASRLPVTVTLLRFALRAQEWAATGSRARLAELVTDGARRLRETMALVGDPGSFRQAVEAERAAWHRLYDTLDALELGVASGDPDALALQQRAREILAGCRVS